MGNNYCASLPVLSGNGNIMDHELCAIHH